MEEPARSGEDGQMETQGQVRVWHPGDGWGVIDSPATPGGCWTHYSALLVAGYRTIEVGAAVELSFEAADQDGFSFRAVEVWPAGQTPVRVHEEVVGPSAAYRSFLSLTHGDDGDAPQHPDSIAGPS